MMKREPLLTEAYFDDYIAFEQENLAVDEKEWQTSQAHIVRPDLAVQIMFNSYDTLFFLKYSRGYPITDLQEDFVELLSALERFIQHPKTDKNSIFLNGEQDGYMHAVALLSLGLLLRVEHSVFRRLVEAIGVNGQDYVLEWLASRRLAHRPALPSTLLFPKTYARLRDATQAPAAAQPPLLQAFLAGWYESVDTVWYECHLGPEGGGFTGYWCWEAAAVAYALQVDDTQLRTMRYYPKDLADFAFHRQPQPA